MPYNYSGWCVCISGSAFGADLLCRQHESPACPRATPSLAEGLQGTADVLAFHPQQSVPSVAASPYDNTSTPGILQHQATHGKVPMKNNHEQVVHDDANAYSGYVLGSFPSPSRQASSRHDIQSSAAGWPSHNATIIKSYRDLSDDPNTYNSSATSDATHHQATNGGGPPMNNYGQVHRDGLPFREISRDGIGRAARWPSHNRTPAHSHHGFADHSSAHSAPGNLPDDDIPSFTQAMYAYGGGLTMNNYAQAPRDDLRLFSSDTLGLPHSADRGISQHDIQSSAAGWPPGSAPSSTVLSSYSSAHPVTLAGNLQNYTIPNVIQHQAARPTTDNHHVYPVNDRRSESRADGRTSVCEWNGDNGPCGMAVNIRMKCIRAHISSDHLEPHLPGTHLVKCRWKDCRSKTYLRRDTIARHVAEVHFGMKRSESGGARAMVP